MLGIAVVVVADGQGRSLVGLEAEIDVEDTEEAAKEQACADEEHTSERDFADDEQRAKTVKVLAFG